MRRLANLGRDRLDDPATLLLLRPQLAIDDDEPAAVIRHQIDLLNGLPVRAAPPHAVSHLSDAERQQYRASVLLE